MRKCALALLASELQPPHLRLGGGPCRLNKNLEQDHLLPLHEQSTLKMPLPPHQSQQCLSDGDISNCDVQEHEHEQQPRTRDNHSLATKASS
jgi:hypothetical protein